MQVKIAYDFDDQEYIAFVDNIPRISGYGITEKNAILDLLQHAKLEEGFNHSVIEELINKIENAQD